MLDREREPRGLRWHLRRGLLLLAVLGLGLAGAACQQPATPVARLQLGVSVDEVLADPQRFIGQTVAINTEVSRVVGEHVVALQSELTDREMLIVLSDEALEAVDYIAAGDRLYVSGPVLAMSRQELQQVEQQLGIQLDEDQLLSLADQAPFVVVQTMRKERAEQSTLDS